MPHKPETFYLEDDGRFPNSSLPVLLYRKALKLPVLFRARFVKRLFRANNWSNNWKAGFFTYAHYHSTTHEALGVCNGKSDVQLGGKKGIVLTIEAGDVLVIPAGVAHKNLGKEQAITCVGGYPDGREYDINTGKAGERPRADNMIAALPVPETDPLAGRAGDLPELWKKKKTIARHSDAG